MQRMFYSPSHTKLRLVRQICTKIVEFGPLYAGGVPNLLPPSCITVQIAVEIGVEISVEISLEITSGNHRPNCCRKQRGKQPRYHFESSLDISIPIALEI